MTTNKKVIPKKVVSKKIIKKEVSEKDTTLRNIKLRDGDYFVATYGGKRIRGIVSKNRYGETWLYNSQGAGKLDCSTDNEEFTHGLELYEQYAEFITDYEKLSESGVTNFRIVTDERVKKVIDSDRVPEFLGYGVRINNKDSFSFGCGAIEVSREKLKDYLLVKKTLAELPANSVRTFYEILESIREEEQEDDRNIRIEDVEKLLKIGK